MISYKLDYLLKHYKECKIDLLSYNGVGDYYIYNLKTNSLTKLTIRNKRKFNIKDIKIFSVI